ncbi:unnamed protein product [Cuscuta epithymum]|uniref:Uncharacterized protein n=1 Tax=Cuscuta epithymum TaxID=186058 RepID=A0AAV0EI09_9ASTE|nr:unnamed protein product [Cuscuta epithymum]CAH9121583.1 unnamed protein product [Cuscuta epithymum]
MASFTVPKQFLNEAPMDGAEEDHNLGFMEPGKILGREDGCLERCRPNRVISKTPGPEVSTYDYVMMEVKRMNKNFKREIEREIAKLIAKQEEEEAQTKKDGGEEDQNLGFNKPSQIMDREEEYLKCGRLDNVPSPERNDRFWDKTPGPEVRAYADVLKEKALNSHKEDLLRGIANKQEEGKERLGAVSGCENSVK